MDESMDKPSKMDKTRKKMPQELEDKLGDWFREMNTERGFKNYTWPYPTKDIQRRWLKEANAEIRERSGDEVTEKKLEIFLYNNRSTRTVGGGPRLLERIIIKEEKGDVTLKMIAEQHGWRGHEGANKKAQEASPNTPEPEQSSVQPKSGASLNTPKSSVRPKKSSVQPKKSIRPIRHPRQKLPECLRRMDCAPQGSGKHVDNPRSTESANHLVHSSSLRTTYLSNWSIAMDHSYCARPPAEANIHPESASTPKATNNTSFPSPQSKSKCPDSPISSPNNWSVMRCPSPDEMAVATPLAEIGPFWILEAANQPTSPTAYQGLSSPQGPTIPAELPLDLTIPKVLPGPSSPQGPTSPAELPLDLTIRKELLGLSSPQGPIIPAELPLDLTIPKVLQGRSSPHGPTSPAELPLDLTIPKVLPTLGSPLMSTRGRKIKATSKATAYLSGMKRRPTGENEQKRKVGGRRKLSPEERAFLMEMQSLKNIEKAEIVVQMQRV